MVVCILKTTFNYNSSIYFENIVVCNESFRHTDFTLDYIFNIFFLICVRKCIYEFYQF